MKNLTSNITLNSERTDLPKMENEPVQQAREERTECKPREGGDADRKGGDGPERRCDLKGWGCGPEGGMRTGKGGTGDGIRATEKPKESTTNCPVCPRKLVRKKRRKKTS